MSLEELRETIDSIDQRIVSLLDERAGAARRIAAEKMHNGLPLHDPKREEEVLDRIAGRSDGSMPSTGLTRIYRQVMTETLALETRCDDDAKVAGQESGKMDVTASIRENCEVAPGYWRMRLEVPALAEAFLPGQFFQLRIRSDGSGPFLRRPFAPAEMFVDGLSFVYAVVGAGTRMMTGLMRGARVNVIAPLGKGYALADLGEEVVLMGGGCGGPSLGPLTWNLAQRGVGTTVILGARSSCGLLSREYLERQARSMVVATDDGSEGTQGTVVNALDELFANGKRIDRIYACGPMPMLREIARVAAARDIFCEVSLEERMACGFGACVGCVVETKTPSGETAFRRVCHDGPVFDASTIKWDAM